MGGQRTLLAGVWWITVFPGLAIVTAVLAVNFAGDALRYSFDQSAKVVVQLGDHSKEIGQIVELGSSSCS